MLLDYGLSGYHNGWYGDLLCYLGQGRCGPQLSRPGSQILLRAVAAAEVARVWERLRPGCWFDLGFFSVESASSPVTDPDRLQFWLRPVAATARHRARGSSRSRPLPLCGC